MMTNTLKQHIHSLHLSGLLNSLELRLQEAEANRLPYAQFLELLLQDEINVRHQRLIARRHKWADFREQRLHRKEGDPSNAAYWYQRAGRPPCRSSLREEWFAIAEALLG